MRSGNGRSSANRRKKYRKSSDGSETAPRTCAPRWKWMSSPPAQSAKNVAAPVQPTCATSAT